MRLRPSFIMALAGLASVGMASRAPSFAPVPGASAANLGKDVIAPDAKPGKLSFGRRFFGTNQTQWHSTKWPYNGKNGAQRARLQAAFHSMS